jgi:hypothetical protein
LEYGYVIARFTHHSDVSDAAAPALSRDHNSNVLLAATEISKTWQDMPMQQAPVKWSSDVVVLLCIWGIGLECVTR